MQFRKAIFIIFLLIVSIGILVMVSKSTSRLSHNRAVLGQAYKTYAEQKSKKPTKQAVQIMDEETSFFSNELLIKVKNRKITNPRDTGIASLNMIFKDHPVKSIEPLIKSSYPQYDIDDWHLLTLDLPRAKVIGKLDYISKKLEVIVPNKSKAPQNVIDSLQILIDKLSKNPNIVSVEPNYQVYITKVPNDPFYAVSTPVSEYLWGMHKIGAEKAWDTSTGSKEIIIADIDTGVDYHHPDLKDNIWINEGEDINNDGSFTDEDKDGIDNDGNGYVDDVLGWDFVNNDNDPMDDQGHGTHTSGTIGAIGNNLQGVVGVNWNVRIMPLKFLSASGSGSESDAIKAFEYATNMGAHISSNSWGGPGFSQALDDMMKYAHDNGMLTVVAAGNSNNDALGYNPACSDYAVTVAATDFADRRAYFSNYGKKIDVAAPGVDVLSTHKPGGQMCGSLSYCSSDGTSMATPHVAGLAGLVLSLNPTLSNEQIRQIIRLGADEIATDKSIGSGRINASRTVELAETNPLAPFISSPKSRKLLLLPAETITGSIDPGYSYTLEYTTSRESGSWHPLQLDKNTGDKILGYLNVSALEDNYYTIRLTQSDGSHSYFHEIHDLLVDNFDIRVSMPARVSAGLQVEIIGTANVKNALEFDRFTIEYGNGSFPSKWSTDGITLTNGGSAPVINGVLAVVDSSILQPDKDYAFRVKVFAKNTVKHQSEIARTYIDKYLVEGWPKAFPFTRCCGAKVSPTLEDLNNDGMKEVIVAIPNKTIYVYNKDGTDFAGFPLFVPDANAFDSNVNVDDLNGDGYKEIIVSSQDRIFVVTNDGQFFPDFVSPEIKYTNYASPTIADIDNDGNKDIVQIGLRTWVGSTDIVIHALNLRGEEIEGFPRSYTLPEMGTVDLPTSTDRGPVMIQDLDGDELVEIGYYLSNRMYLFDNKGDILPNWPFIAPKFGSKYMFFTGPPVSGDIDGDGQLEIAATTRGDGCAHCEAQLFAWEKNGTVLMERTDLTTDFNGICSPSMIDMDNDGKDEIIGGFGKLMIFDIEGPKIFNNKLSMETQPSIADIDGDGEPEYIGNYGAIRICKINGSDFIEYWSAVDQPFYAPPAVADIDDNGHFEIAAFNRPYSVADLNIKNHYLYLWEIPNPCVGCQEVTHNWPMFSHDPQRSGRLSLQNASLQPMKMHIGDLDIEAKAISDSWSATAIIAVHDKNEALIGNAIVTGSWTNSGVEQTSTCVTNSQGLCNVTSGLLNDQTAETMFVVNNIQYSDYVYNNVRNHDPDSDSDGTSITVSMPILCHISSARWMQTEVIEGADVQMNVVAQNCEEFLYEIYENDPLLSDVLVDAFITTSLSPTWKAVYSADGLGNPEYYFRVSVHTIKIKSENMLTVYRANVCGNKVCEGSENFKKCPSDCEKGDNPSDSTRVCGNGICDKGENSRKCPSDCP